ncbi:MAG TPA: CaiB/BaiF CoA-transferase family protein [Mycobacteriales bacterium]|nr:CaiB/BaiF CoA-transferase family protein [Mycobacteriales bacterium]
MLPLDGVLVVGLEVAVSAPHCTRQLADLGARVIKIESGGGDFARWYDDAVGEVSAHFAWANRGKESAVLDLKAEADRAVVERMLARADVLVQNLAPGSAERLGLDARSAVDRHPRLVAVDISGYGHGGPRATSRAYDLLVQAESGSCAVTGEPGHPAKPGIPLADIGTGMVAANAVLAALLARGRTGAGAAISVAMFDVVTDWMSWALHQARSSGTDPLPRGMSSPMVSPYGAFETADGQTLVVGTTNDGEWQRLATDVLGRPDLADDPRYAGNADRVRRRAEIDAVIAEWAAGQTFAVASAAAERAGIGWARYNTPTEVLAHPQLSERDRWVTTAAPGGEFSSLRPAADCPSWAWEPQDVPGLGVETEAVRREFRAGPG